MESKLKIIRDIVTDEERAFYGISGALIENCRFEGKADGESALKESSDIKVVNSDFVLRYPFWHTKNGVIENCRLYDTCRAALWYDDNIKIFNSNLGGIKAVRECNDVYIECCNIVSPEFGWFNKNIVMKDCTVESEYFLLHSSNIKLYNVKLKGKYSFQYCKNVEIYNSVLDTKDAFWETENVTVYDSVVNGEYLAWYADNLKLVNCNIAGTQPLCYSNNVVLRNCTMTGCDLAFEKTSVFADVRGKIDSVKNPLKGTVTANQIGEIIDEYNTPCKIIIKQ